MPSILGDGGLGVLEHLGRHLHRHRFNQPDPRLQHSLIAKKSAGIVRKQWSYPALLKLLASFIENELLIPPRIINSLEKS